MTAREIELPKRGEEEGDVAGTWRTGTGRKRIRKVSKTEGGKDRSWVKKRFSPSASEYLQRKKKG